MAKVKYHFNTKSLAVEPVKETFKDKLKKFMRVVLAGMLFTVIVLALGWSFFESPKEKMQARELYLMRTQYQVVNDRLDMLANVLEDIQTRDDHIYRVIFEAEPIPKTVREAAIGGAERYSHLDGFDNSDLVKSTVKRIDQLSRQMYVQSKSYDDVFSMAKDKANMLASIPAIVPIARGSERLISGFGPRIHPVYKTLRPHTGVDFTAPTGTPIYAAGNGVVTKSERNRHGYGIMVQINHGYGYETLYAHMSRLNVKVGQEVKRGEIIGYVGNTGVSTAPHLHYEVVRHGVKVNPVNYFFNDITPEEYQEIIEKASQVNQSLS
ncbi:MAG: M23 family metallopeptidase [Bacteroidetes bacterium]|nr:M23 family metallopeptidase [Bacteroidota bacterium]